MEHPIQCSEEEKEKRRGVLFPDKQLFISQKKNNSEEHKRQTLSLELSE